MRDAGVVPVRRVVDRGVGGACEFRGVRKAIELPEIEAEFVMGDDFFGRVVSGDAAE